MTGMNMLRRKSVRVKNMMFKRKNFKLNFDYQWLKTGEY